MKQPRDKISGWLAFDKPYTMGSTQAVAKIRYMFNAEKAGHGGTLDPLASGLLPIALGEATKTVQWAMDGAKTYLFTAKWGAETSTDDLEGEITQTSDKQRPTQAEIEAVLPAFSGDIQQAPPAYSAILINGERAYDLARAGEAPEMVKRQVQIHALKLLKATPDQAEFEVHCGKGTYIRSLARDIGRTLGCLAHVTVLRRIQVGGLNQLHMISLEKLEEISHRGGIEALKGALLPLETVLDGIPACAVLEQDAAKLRQGQKVLLPGNQVNEAAVLVRTGSNLVGIGEIDQRVLKIKRLFNL